MINVLRHGAVGDGITDDTPAFLSAISEMIGVSAAAIGYWHPLYIPSGTYRLTQPLHLVSNGRIIGDGAGLSWLVWDSGDGLSFTSSSDDQEILDISGISFRTQGAGGTALKADFSAQVSNGMSIRRFFQRFLIRNCSFEPHESEFTQGWNVAFDSIAGLNGLVHNCNAFGRVDPVIVGDIPVPTGGTIGFRFRGTAPNLIDNGHPVANIVRDSWMAYHENSIIFEGCEGGFVSGCNIIGVTNGIVWDSSASPEIQRPQLNVTATHVNSSAAGITAKDLSDAQISTSLFYNFLPSDQPPSIGIRMYGNLGALTPLLACNTFCGNRQPMNGIVIERGSYGNISNNLFHVNIPTAITLGANSDHFTGSGNIFAPSTLVGVADSGSANTVS